MRKGLIESPRFLGEPDSNLMSKPTPLIDVHEAAGGKMVDFAGWRMPLHYGSQLKEHEAVRSGCGIFDVSHMTIIDFAGTEQLKFLQFVTANDPGRLAAGEAQYGVLLDANAGIVDDLIVYRIGDNYRAVVNSATRDSVLELFAAAADNFAVQVLERPTDAMVAVQGPQALAVFEAAAGTDVANAMSPFTAIVVQDWIIARTGYTGEDGVEVMLPGNQAEGLWRRLTRAGATPCGLGARDTLRLEAGLNLYGQDMDRGNHPFESALGWTIAWEPASRDFQGRAVLAERRKTYDTKLTGVMLEAKGVMRHGYTVDCGEVGSGVVTSGIFSPTLGYSIGLARVPRAAKGACTIEIRGKQVPARIVKPPFVRNGAKVFK